MMIKKLAAALTITCLAAPAVADDGWWCYQDHDEMRNITIRAGSLASTHGDGDAATKLQFNIMSRNGGALSAGIYFTGDRDFIVCNTCEVSIKFDDGPIHTMKVQGRGFDTNISFHRPGLAEAFMRAKRVIIEVPTAANYDQQYHFAVKPQTCPLK